MKGEQHVPLSQDQTWEALNDPDVLANCIPGCESMEQTGDNEFKAKVRTSVGPVNAQFKGKVKLSDVNPPNSYKMTFKGDGTAGFAQGTASVQLASSDGGTTINYDAQAKVGGKLAQIGSRLIDGAARKMADEFFTNLTTHLGGNPQTDPKPEQPAAKSAGGLAGLLAAINNILARLFGRSRDS